MKRLLTSLLAAGLTLSLVSCGSKIAPPMEAVDLMAAVTPNAADTVPPTEEQAAALTGFGLLLLQETAEAGESRLLSPLSAAAALSMAANGAGGETLTQLEQLFGLSLDQLNAALPGWLSVLPDQGDTRLLNANSIWLRDDPRLTVEPDFLQTNADRYSAEIYKAPFDGGTLRDINRWVSDKTLGRIPAVLDQIPESAVLYLINALAFDGLWQEPYEDSQIGDRNFTGADGTVTRADFLHSTEGLYLSDDRCTGVIKPYKGGSCAFAALLPRKGTTPEELLSGLDGRTLHSLLTRPSAEEVITAIPEFKAEDTLELAPVLARLGVTDAFDPERADLTPMGRSDSGNLYLSRVLQKTCLELDRSGTKAAAATLIEAADGCAALPDEPPKEVILDRPFVYLLLDTQTGIPFFIGTLEQL